MRYTTTIGWSASDAFESAYLEKIRIIAIKVFSKHAREYDWIQDVVISTPLATSPIDGDHMFISFTVNNKQHLGIDGWNHFYIPELASDLRESLFANIPELDSVDINTEE